MIDCILVSYVIPLFNTSKKNFLRCIRSILNNSFFSFEIILIDDGSEQNISKEYMRTATENAKIKYKKIKNAGAANARNVGMHIARGKYICFVDSDDYIGNGNDINACVKQMEIKKLDLLFGCNNKSVDINKQVSNKMIQIDILEQRIFGGAVQFGSPWAKIFRREFLINNKIVFDVELRRCHDRLFMLNVMNSQPNFEISEKILYYFCNDEKESLSRAWNPKTEQYLLLYLERCKNYINKFYSVDEDYNRTIEKLEMLLFRQCAYQVIFHPHNISSFYRKYREYKRIESEFLEGRRAIVNYMGKGMLVFSILVKCRLNLLSAAALEVNKVIRSSC